MESLGDNIAHNIFERWLMQDQRARMIVDTEGQVHWMNSVAADMLAQKSPLRIYNKRVCPTDANQSRAFEAFISSARRGGSLFSLCDAHPENRIVLRAQLLDSAIGNENPLVGLSAIGTGEPFDPPYDDFGEALSLTPAETRVVKMLLNGCNADQIAQETGATVGTVRTHIRNVYGKLGVSSREALFQRMQPFRN